MNEQQSELIPQTNNKISPEEQAKSEEYRQRLAEYLKDPAFRGIEGFPIGTDEDILALSDPPYYTACPNPFIPEILEEWQQEREDIRKELGLADEKYHREPFAADVSEGKNDPIYNAHSYHTKVPHKAIMRYILHYTDPGDIVFDGFCGTGMTGIAAQFCGDKKTIESLGYRVDEKGMIWEGGKAFSHLGSRKAVLNDLSPAATFIAYNYNTPVDVNAFEKEAKRILKEVERECGWMYETWHPNYDKPNRMKGKINYIIWSDVFLCPTCGFEMVYWDVARNEEIGKTKDSWNCPGCDSILGKNPNKDSAISKAECLMEKIFDIEINQTIFQSKQVPVMINYTFGKKRFWKIPDHEDIKILQEIISQPIPYNFPTNRMPEGSESRRNDDVGLTHVHHYYTKRNLWILAKIHNEINKIKNNIRLRHFLEIWFTSSQSRLHKLNRYMYNHKRHVGPLSGTLYISSTPVEISPFIFSKEKLKDHQSLVLPFGDTLISTKSSTRLSIPNESIDYIFVDPPFGANLNYSELNFLIESWIKVITNSKKEAIVNKPLNKLIPQYAELMTLCFKEFNRIIKAGGWITVEFHNSQNSVWNALQEALQQVGFLIADVRILDKTRGGLHAMIGPTATKQDLVISAYKPNGNLEEHFRLKAGTEDGAWEFIRYHLGKLPVINNSNNTLAVNVERQSFLLYDRMVAFHVQRGVMVPISASEFYAGLEERFTPREGMYFLPDQVAEYDRAILESGKPTQLNLFVNDEKTAIAWLRQQLDPKSGGEPKTQGDLTNDFNRVMNRAKHEQQLELIEILKQNFLQDQDGKWYVPDHNKASDIEKIRQRTLLREFKEYTESKGRLRVFRSEAVRAGFADCFKNQDYETIVQVAERLPEVVLREDPDLLMYYDSALLRKVD